MIPISWLWYRLTGIDEMTAGINSKPKVIDCVKEGISFRDDVIVSHFGSETIVFSGTCPHAGCLISKSAGDKIICSCHGSQFDGRTGKVLKGPAVADLRKIAFTMNSQKEKIFIHP
jgi:Rieske Fe-S protein